MAKLEPLMRENFLEYASYVIVDRAIPSLADGLKPVQRRILHTLFEVNDGRFHKVANIIGETMKLHPHGDASIGDALVVLANKDYFIEKQGNFGNPLSGHRAAAPRYIECRLNELALETLFSPALCEFIPSYDGRKDEPIALPAKVPVVLMLGTEGIAVGMSTRILPHNFGELLKAQIAILRDEKFSIFPDFPQGGIMDAADYTDGRGKVRLRARIIEKNTKTLTITELPYGTTTETLIASIESAAQKGRVKIASIDDFTTDKVEIDLTLQRGIDAAEAIPQLYAYTECEVSLNSNILMIAEQRPVELGVSETLKALTAQLKSLLKAELEYERGRLEDKEHWMTLERIFIEEKIYRRLEQATTEHSLHDEVAIGLEPFKKLFLRELCDDDITRLLGLAIRRISAFDREKHDQDMATVLASLKRTRTKLRNMKQTTITYLESLLKKYAERYPRRTKITTFTTIDKKRVARQTIRLSYDPESSFFGSQIRGSEFVMTVSEYDRILIVSSDGTYRIVPPVEKILLPKNVLYANVFDQDTGITLSIVYRDKLKNAFAKKVRVQGFIKGKEYRLFKDTGGRVDLFWPDHAQGTVRLRFVPARRQKIKDTTYDLAQLDYCGLGARGVRLSTKSVAKVQLLRSKC